MLEKTHLPDIIENEFQGISLTNNPPKEKANAEIAEKITPFLSLLIHYSLNISTAVVIAVIVVKKKPT